MYARADPGFQAMGAHLNKLRRAERGAKIFGVFRVINHDFRQKIIFFPILEGAPGAPPPTPPWNRPWYVSNTTTVLWKAWIVYPSHSMQSSVDQCKSQSAYKYDLFCFRMGHIIGSDGLEIRRMYIYVINKDGHCAFQYLIHFFCFTRTDQNERKVH